MTAPLYELATQYKELSEIDDIDPQAIADTLEGITDSIERKAEAIVAVRANMKGTITAIDAEIDRLTKRKNSIANQEAALRAYLKANMERMEMTNIKCHLFSITLAKGRDVVVIDDDDALPDDCVSVSTTVKANKKLIGERLKNGEDVPGARLSKSEKSILIK